jgi:hypothetical protein
MNIWAGIIIGAVALGVYGFSKLGHAGNNLVTEVTGRIHSIDFQNVTFALDVKIKNPSPTAINLNHPFIKIFYKEKLITSSEIKNAIIKIEPSAETNISNIKIPVSFLKMGGVALDFMKKLTDKTVKITLQVETSTYILVAGNKIPYSKTEDITV